MFYKTVKLKTDKNFLTYMIKEGDGRQMNDAANDFWEEQGYTLRTNLNYRNKSLNENVPQGE